MAETDTQATAVARGVFLGGAALIALVVVVALLISAFRSQSVSEEEACREMNVKLAEQGIDPLDCD